MSGTCSAIFLIDQRISYDKTQDLWALGSICFAQYLADIEANELHKARGAKGVLDHFFAFGVCLCERYVTQEAAMFGRLMTASNLLTTYSNDFEQGQAETLY